MWYDLASAIETAQMSASVALVRIYKVKADASYGIQRAAKASDTFVLVRTQAGTGEFRLGNQAPLRVGRESLLLTADRSIRRYRSEGNQWDFWWFEFQAMGPLPLPKDRVLEIPAVPHEAAEMQACFRELKRVEAFARSLASSRLSRLLHLWAEACALPRPDQPVHLEAVHRVINAMNADLAHPLSLPEMAEIACLSERRFRDVFQALMGASPKKFYDKLRMEAAAELLRAQGLPIAVIADRLGYSSPFHFSRAFRNHFGMPPGRYGGS